MSKEKIEILKKELEELSQQRNEVEARDRELEEQEKPMREEWEREKLKLKELGHENSEASRKLKTELEELRKTYLKEPEENLKKVREQVGQLSKDVQTIESLLQGFQARLSSYKSDLLNPSKSFNYMEGIISEDSGISLTPDLLEYSELSKPKRWKKHVEKLAKSVENLEKDVEYYKTRFESAKTKLEIAKKESLEIESRLKSAEISFHKNPEYLKLKAQLQELDTQKQELDTQKGELHSKMYGRVLTTREKIDNLEGERVKKEHQLKLQLEEARIKLENFNLELGKKSNLQKILAEEFNLATSQEEKEALQKVQKSTEKKIEVLQDEISHYQQILTPQQEPSSNSSSSSDSSSSLSSSYSSSSSSSSDSTTSETSPSSSSEPPVDLILFVSPISTSSTGSNLSEEIHTLGDTSQEGSDL